MANSDLDNALAAQVATLVTFRWHDQVRRYALWTSDVVVGANTYTAVTKMMASMGEQHGGTEDTPFEVELPNNLEPVNHLTGQRFTPTWVSVEECDPNDAVATLRNLNYGLVIVSKAEPDGRRGHTRLRCGTLKRAFATSLGMPATGQCSNRLGQGLCKYNIEGATATGTLSAKDEQAITITGLPPRSNGHWRRGTVSYQGYSIAIRDWESGTVFLLAHKPPRSWTTGVTLTLRPGCDGTLGSCRGFGQESNFMALGIAMLDRNPQLDEGDDQATG